MPDEPERFNPLAMFRRFIDEKHAEALLPAASLVWMCLLRHSDNDGISYPPISLIASECGISEQAVRTAIRGFKGTGANLVARGYVSVEQNYTNKASMRYKITLPDPQRSTQLTSTQLTSTELTSTQLIPRGQHSRPPEVNSVDPKVPIKVPSEGTQYYSSGESDSTLTKSPKPKKKPAMSYEDIDVELTNRLRDLNRTWNPKWDFAGKIENHYNEMRLLRTQGHPNEKGKIDVARIRAALDWLAQDSFWIPNRNVQSVSKFREKFARFDGQASRNGYSEPTLPLVESDTAITRPKSLQEQDAELREQIREAERKRVAAGGKSDRVLFMENRIKTFKMDVAKCWGTWGDECEKVWGKDWKDVVTKISEGGA